MKQEDSEVIILLLNAGANVNHSAACFSGGTALEAAVMNTDIELVKYLLSIEADADDPTALLMAVVHQKVELVQILLAARGKVDVFGKKWYGCAALQAAVKKGQFELVKILLTAGIDVNTPPLLNYRMEHRFSMIIHGITALCTAIKHQNLSLVRILLQAGADPNIIMEAGDTHLV